VQNKAINVQHISGKINPADIFTKEMRDGTHFRRLWDFFMSRLSDFINNSLLAIHHTNQQSPKQIVPSAAKAILTVHPYSYFSALSSHIIFLLLHLHCHFTFLQCWLSASPEFSQGCSTTSYIAVVPLIILVWSGCWNPQ
jgi:hypothetical protein